jgi:hypothetical protein
MSWLKHQSKLAKEGSFPSLESKPPTAMSNFEITTQEKMMFPSEGPGFDLFKHASTEQVKIKRDKVILGMNEVDRSKIGSFFQMINNVQSGHINSQVQLSAVGSNIPVGKKCLFDLKQAKMPLASASQDIITQKQL